MTEAILWWEALGIVRQLVLGMLGLILAMLCFMIYRAERFYRRRQKGRDAVGVD